MNIRGNRRHLFAMQDSETRFWIAKMVAEHKGNDYVAHMSEQAKNVAGKSPPPSSATRPPIFTMPRKNNTEPRTSFPMTRFTWFCPTCVRCDGVSFSGGGCW